MVARNKKARKTSRKVERPAAEPKFHIIWSPQSDKPPRVRFNRDKAEEVADIMVKKYGTQFYVMSSVSLHQMAKPERIPCTGKEVPRATETDRFSEAVQNVSNIPKPVDPPAPMSNAGQHWSIDQDRYLRRLHNQGRTWSYIATAMGRSKLAIQYRLEHLGLIDNGGEIHQDIFR